MKLNSVIKFGVAVTTGALLLAGCSSAGEGDAAETVVMYTTNNENAVGAVVDAAAGQDPALKVDVVNGAVVSLMQRIEAEDGRNSADLFYSATPTMLRPFEKLYEPYDSPEAAALPKELVDPEHRWTVQNSHVVAVMVNTDQLGDLSMPKTWADLADPKWEGKILSGSPAESGTADTALFGAAQVLSPAQLEQLIKNLDVTADTATLYPAVAQGEYAVTLGYEANIYPYIEGGAEGIELLYPEDGTFVTHEAIAIMKKASNPDAAKRLADTILSKDTQIELLKKSFRRPARSDIDASEHLDIPKIADIKVVEVDREALADEHEKFLKLWADLKQ